jgi:hypothetical protein
MNTLELENAALRNAVEERMAGCCEWQRCEPKTGWQAATQASAEKYAQRFTGDGLLTPEAHPTSQRFFDLCDSLKEMHRSKSHDYGCPSGTDPLANIRNGAKFVGIPSWKGAMVRLSDKVTRLASFNATGRLHNEGVVDNLLDLASYSLLALLLFQEEQDDIDE